jgi:hypothetical protein
MLEIQSVMKRAQLTPCSPDIARRVAKIIGPYSAAAMALAELDARTERGENVSLYTSGNSFVVGPLPTEFSRRENSLAPREGKWY